MLVIQFTGLSGAGKTTIAYGVQQHLQAAGIQVEIIDGDQYRKTVCSDLGFSRIDRYENIRRLGKIAYEFSRKKNSVAILAAINPYEEIRQELKITYNAKTVLIDCNLKTLLQRDTKGLYQRALLPDGHPDKLKHLTGVNDPYEIPSNPDLIIKTCQENLEESVAKLCHFILCHINSKASD